MEKRRGAGRAGRGRVMKDPRDVIIQPVVLGEVLRPHRAQQHLHLRSGSPGSQGGDSQAVEVLFDVRVLRVNTLNRKGKRKRTRFTVGKRADTKRAMVTLPIGQTVDIFGT